mmetsp:Transcript_101976/g.287862  ORF Transcript_101976/g.287862 Transcript_101976/m.287862 type:complete len:226 (-) Transcript_101976:87-764(-)|eukprot:CAMPEP_0117471728 /NCGR_PEP_ID=MMETSP0784-20121206/7879_1 /TAXON_ID=39447 /ORGANISM="" /LENGTH=225 /DNA_ID=CAMNT_0005265853 /DNA_START=36 /DNA_END=713 /DNA_ORIENTATION=-
MDDALAARIEKLVSSDPSLGYRAIHARLKEEPQFQEIGLKKVQTTLQRIREAAPVVATPPPAAPRGHANPGENIWTAASDGDTARVEELMHVEGFGPTSPDENGYTPVHAAASYGHVELLRMLLERDGNGANVGDSDGDTPLHHVASASDLEEDQLRPVVALLLEHRADPTLTNNEQKSCLDLCGESVLEGDDENAELNLAFVKILAEHGIQIECTEKDTDDMAA